MSAPKGNQFWKLRSKHGRDKIFSDSDTMLKAAYEYFQWCDENPWVKIDFKGKDAEMVEIPTARPYTMEGLCIYLGVNTQYFSQFKANLSEGEKDFSLVITHIEEVIRNRKLEGATVGAYNANIVARDLGLKEQTETTAKINVDPKEWV